MSEGRALRYARIDDDGQDAGPLPDVRAGVSTLARQDRPRSTLHQMAVGAGFVALQVVGQQAVPVVRIDGVLYG